MSVILGIDTSNYTTSAALYFSASNTVSQQKMLLPVKKGEKGIRQSDAVFHHTVQLPQVLEKLYSNVDFNKIDAVGVSYAPRREDGSYMPCFLSGVSAAKAISLACNIPLYELSHQEGHIIAALFSAQRLDLLKEKFVAFHLSGGTTEALLVSPSENNIFSSQIISKSLDLKAGQAIDRVGLMLGLDFPAGPMLEKLSEESGKSYKIKPSMKENDCSLSGIENKCKKMISENEKACDIAEFCIESIISAIEGMVISIFNTFGKLPFLFSGGVTSNKKIRKYFENKYDAIFSDPIYSADNAAGIAVLSYLKHQG